MAFYDICPRCGASLDPGEKCDCEETAEREQEERERFLVREEGTNQYAFNLFPEREKA